MELRSIKLHFHFYRPSSLLLIEVRFEKVTLDQFFLKYFLTGQRLVELIIWTSVTTLRLSSLSLFLIDI